MKKIIILKHGGGELANQLWNYISVYAYGLEVGIEIKNPSFFEYHSFFNFLPQENILTKSFSLFFKKPRRRSHFINRLGRIKYALLVRLMSALHPCCLFSSENVNNTVTYIPPTKPLPQPFTQCDTLYFSGWLFRNPKGLLKFKDELHKIFTPAQEIQDQVKSIIDPLRLQYTNIIGIHIRQSDYRDFKKGTFIIKQNRIRSIIDEYILEKRLNVQKTVFVITSDGFVDTTFFKDLNIMISKENSVTDLFLLAETDTILGSDSSFGAFAAWYGDIPHIIFKEEALDWNYYKDKKSFFENKYSLLARY